jgi:hypothetical protein
MNKLLISKRCGCRDIAGRRVEQRCTRLGQRPNGTSYFYT